MIKLGFYAGNDDSIALMKLKKELNIHDLNDWEVLIVYQYSARLKNFKALKGSKLWVLLKRGNFFYEIKQIAKLDKPHFFDPKPLNIQYLITDFNAEKVVSNSDPERKYAVRNIYSELNKLIVNDSSFKDVTSTILTNSIFKLKAGQYEK